MLSEALENEELSRDQKEQTTVFFIRQATFSSSPARRFLKDDRDKGLCFYLSKEATKLTFDLIELMFDESRFLERLAECSEPKVLRYLIAKLELINFPEDLIQIIKTRLQVIQVGAEA